MSTKPEWGNSTIALALAAAGMMQGASALAGVPGAAAGQGGSTYVVQPGDTLSSIAKSQLNAPQAWRQLQKLNRIADPNVLRPGSSLRLPAGKDASLPAKADVIMVKGEVRVRLAKGGAFTPLASGAQLDAGTVIETGATGLLTLRFADRSRLLLSPNSRLVLTRMMMDGVSGAAVTQAHLESGDAESIVTPLRGINARYEVKTPGLNLAVRGTAFRVQFEEGTGVTRAMVSEGLVKAGNEFGEKAIPAGNGTTAALGQGPLAPRPLLPAPKVDVTEALVETFPLGIAWQQTPGAGQYRVQLLEGGELESLVDMFAVDGTESHWRRLPNGTYRLRIRGVDDARLEGSNAEVQFKVQAWPPAPLIAAPANGSVVSGQRIKFRWARVQGAEFLRFQVAKDQGFSHLLMDVRNLTGKSNGLTVPLPPGQYFWRIAAGSAADGVGPFGAVQSFEVRDDTAAALGTEPGNGNVLRWRQKTEGERYVVQMARQENFASPLLEKEVKSAEMAVPNAGLMYVRIKRIAPDGFAGEFEAPQLFDAVAE